jgi:SAM-dependent MidA family methyltransferase
MDLALYDSQAGYYARAAQRSGRAGDFFTSVDGGALFGELLEVQIAEMAELLSPIAPPDAAPGTPNPDGRRGGNTAGHAFDLVEAGCGNGRLSTDILNAARERDPVLYDRTRLHLVEVSADARAAQRATLGRGADRLATSAAVLPSSFEGVLIANELLDAMPVHQVVMREEGLREIYVEAANGTDALSTREGPLSTPAIEEYLARLDLDLEPGWRAEVNLRALEWVRDAASRLRRGFIILIDYGHEARDLYSVSHAAGTLTTYARHTAAGPESNTSIPPWLLDPGGQDMTAHVDFTSVRAAATAAGLETLGFLDQTYFLMGLLDPERFTDSTSFKQRLALKTLLMPGGLGSTMKVFILGKDVGTPSLRGCSYRMRVT